MTVDNQQLASSKEAGRSGLNYWCGSIDRPPELKRV